MICGTIFGSRPLLPHVLKRPQSDNPSPPRVCYLLNYFGAIAQFFQFRFRGYWQVAHKWRFMLHLSVSPVPKSRKTVHLPQSNSTPEVTNSISSLIQGETLIWRLDFFFKFNKREGSDRIEKKNHFYRWKNREAGNILENW